MPELNADSTGIEQVDARGPRFAAWVTTIVLAGVITLSAVSIPAASALLGAQAVAFAVGAVAGPRRHPYAWFSTRIVAPRLGPITAREPTPPLRFAQLVGLVFAIIGLIGFSSGSALIGVLATAFALSAAFLNAAFNICLGCRIYPLVARLRTLSGPA